MNSSILRKLTFLVFGFLVFACAGKKEGSPISAQTEWKEMDEFHMVMAETFHPYKDSANLEPAKTRAVELASAAENWAGSPLPEKIDNSEMKDRLEQLKTETSTLVQTVSTADDQAIGDQLTKVHDLFHRIQEAWYGGGENHEH